MNIIYLLTNTSKTTGRRFYVGSKVECRLIDVEGIPTIWNMKTQKPYYSSSKNFEFLEDFKRGDVFKAEILEVVMERKNINVVENKHIIEHNAVDSDEYYNMSMAFANTYNFKAIANKYGETVAEYASRCSQSSKRDGTAKGLGYKNFGEMYFHMQAQLNAGCSIAELSQSCGKHRKWAQITLKPYDMEKAKVDVTKNLTEEIREMVSSGASLKKAAELLEIELPAARVMLGDFDKEGEKSFSVAKQRGKSKEELEIEITRRILEGEGFIEIANSMTLCRESILRYFLRCLRANKLHIMNVIENPF